MVRIRLSNFSRNVDCPLCGKKTSIQIELKYLINGQRNPRYRTPNHCGNCKERLPY